MMSIRMPVAWIAWVVRNEYNVDEDGSEDDAGGKDNSE